jgi:predicted lipoprotein with Yx(FWY)xxD motif
MKILTSCLAAVALTAGCSIMSPSPTMTSDGALTGPNGMSLYTFDRDSAGSGKSACNGQCAALWPPLLASDTDKASGDYAIIVRDDGKKQWAYKGKPLYYFSRDAKAGERAGDGFNQVWKTARP